MHVDLNHYEIKGTENIVHKYGFIERLCLNKVIHIYKISLTVKYRKISSKAKKN